MPSLLSQRALRIMKLTHSNNLACISETVTQTEKTTVKRSQPISDTLKENDMNAPNLSPSRYSDAGPNSLLLEEVGDDLLETSLNDLDTSIFDKSNLFEKETNNNSVENSEVVKNLENNADFHENEDTDKNKTNEENVIAEVILDPETGFLRVVSGDAETANKIQNIKCVCESEDGNLDDNGNGDHTETAGETSPIEEQRSDTMEMSGDESVVENRGNSSESSSSSETDWFAVQPGTKRKKFLHSRKERDNIKKANKILSYKVKQPCKCKRKCSEKISNEVRFKTNNRFWNLDYSGRKAFILATCTETEIKRKRKSTGPNSRKKKVISIT